MNEHFVVAFFFFLFIGYCLYLHFKCYPVSLFPMPKLLFHLLSPCLLWGCFPTHLHTPNSAPSNFPTLVHRVLIVLGPILPLVPYKAILCYICSWFLPVFFLVGGLVSGGFQGGWVWLVDIDLCMVSKPFSSFSHFSSFSTEYPVISSMVGCKH